MIPQGFSTLTLPSHALAGRTSLTARLLDPEGVPGDAHPSPPWTGAHYLAAALLEASVCEDIGAGPVLANGRANKKYLDALAWLRREYVHADNSNPFADPEWVCDLLGVSYDALLAAVTNGHTNARHLYGHFFSRSTTRGPHAQPTPLTYEEDSHNRAGREYKRRKRGS